jgi:hypothetical protein
VFRKFKIFNLSRPSDDDVTYAVTLYSSHFSIVYLRDIYFHWVFTLYIYILYTYHVLGILELHPALVIGQLSRNSSPNMSQGTQLLFCAGILMAVCDISTYCLDSSLRVRCVHILVDTNFPERHPFGSYIYTDTCICVHSPSRKIGCDCVREESDRCVVLVVLVVLLQCVDVRLLTLMVEMWEKACGNTNVCCW